MREDIYRLGAEGHAREGDPRLAAITDAVRRLALDVQRLREEISYGEGTGDPKS